MADLRVSDDILDQVTSRLRAAVNRLDPVHRGVTSLDPEVVGADPLVTALRQAHALLAAELQIMGVCLNELHGQVGNVGTTMQQVDTNLSSRMRQES